MAPVRLLRNGGFNGIQQDNKQVVLSTDRGCLRAVLNVPSFYFKMSEFLDT